MHSGLVRFLDGTQANAETLTLNCCNSPCGLSAQGSDLYRTVHNNPFVMSTECASAQRSDLEDVASRFLIGIAASVAPFAREMAVRDVFRDQLDVFPTQIGTSPTVDMTNRKRDYAHVAYIKGGQTIQKSPIFVPWKPRVRS